MGDLLGFLTETATLYRRTGSNAFGDPVRDTGRDVLCRVRLRRLEQRAQGGTETSCPGEVWLPPDETVAPGDQFLYDGEYLDVRGVEAVTDVAGERVALRALTG